MARARGHLHSAGRTARAHEPETADDAYVFDDDLLAIAPLKACADRAPKQYLRVALQHEAIINA
jgi:hypothetical protein